MRILKYVGIAGISLACSIGFAQAQTALPGGGGPALNPSQLQATIKPGVTNGVGKIGGGAAQAFSTGWNYRHCFEAIWWDNGTSGYYVEALNVEGDVLYSYVPYAGSGNNITQNTLNLLCSRGGGYYVYVLASGAFTELNEEGY